MYDYVEGRAVERRPGHLVLEAGGIGYEIAVPLGADFPAREGRVRAWTHFVVREDSHRLFGFPARDGRELFRLLLEVRGVGPSAALAVLSTLPGDEPLRAVVAQDPKPFLRVKGIGKKTAEQILLDLREKAPRMLPTPGTIAPRAAEGAGAGLEDAVRALVSIGFSDKEARASVERAATKVPAQDLERLVRAALQE